MSSARPSTTRRLLRTKFHIPALDVRLVERPRLFAALDRGLSAQMTLVAAPAGYGKSTLAAAWLHARGLAGAGDATSAAEMAAGAVWYALDRHDDVPETFLTYLIHALQGVQPQVGMEALAMLEQDQHAFAPAAHSLLYECLDLPERVMVVLDDYHSIRAAAIHDFVRQLVQHASSTLHVMILSRIDPPLRLARLKAHGGLAEIRAHDLRFTPEEVRAYLDSNFDRTVSDEIARGLAQRTEGWAVGLQLSTIAMRAGHDAEAFVRRLDQHANRYVIDYLVDEVLEEQAPEVRDFLMATSLLPRFNAALAAQVTGVEVQESMRVLEQLRRANLFLIDLDDRAEWYRYHHQFQEVLLNRLRMHWAPSELVGLRIAAAAWFETAQLPDEALEQLVGAEQWEQAIGLVERLVDEVFEQEDWTRLERLMAMLPPALVDDQPALLFAKACCCAVRNDYVEAFELTERAEMLLEQGRCAPEQARRLLAQIYVLRAPIGERYPVAQRIAWLEDACRVLRPEEGWFGARAHSMLALRLGESGRLDEARRIQTEALSHMHAASPAAHLQMMFGQSTQSFIRGTLDEAEHDAGRYRELALRYGRPISLSWATYCLGGVLHQRGELEEAERLLCMFVDPRAPTPFDIRATALAELAVVCVELRHFDLLLQAIAQLRVHVTPYAAPDQQSVLDAYQALAAMLLGQYAEARAWAIDAGARPLSFSFSTLSVPIIRARILMMSDEDADLQLAIDILQERLRQVRQLHMTRFVIQIGTILPVIYWTRGQKAEALDTLEEAVALGYPLGYRWWFYEKGPAVVEMLQELVRRKRHAAEAEALLADFPPAARERTLRGRLPRLDVDVLAQPLTQRELEILELLDQSLSNKEIAQKLCVSPITVRNHTTRIYEKLHVHNRLQATQRARELKLIL